MAISNFTRITDVRWSPGPNGYSEIPASASKTGTSNSDLIIKWYRSTNTATPNAFAIAISSSATEALSLSKDASVDDKLNLDCATAISSQGTTYFTLTESQGWTMDFNVTVYVTNRNSTNGTMVFTKGKGGHRPT